MADLHPDSVVTASPRQVSAETAGETAVLDLDAGVYYGLDRTGTSVWRRIQEPISVAELCRQLAREYEADENTLQRDVLTLLCQLRDEALVSVSA